MIQQLQTLLAQAQLIDGSYVPQPDLENQISTLSFQAVIWGSIVLVVLVLISAAVREHLPKLKKPLFLAISLTVIATSFFLIGSTIYLNVNSESGGPVHWHADFELWACGEELELRDPTGALSNKIGSPSLHEHNDRRIHLEGVLVENRDASVGKFFYEIGGGISENGINIPLNEDGPYFDDEDQDYIGDQDVREALVREYVNQARNGDSATFIDGQTCPNGEQANFQMFAYEIATNEDGSYVEEDGATVYHQRKVEDPVNYMINGESVVPPGDCLIFEFSELKNETDKLCRQFEVHGTGHTIINEDGEEVESLGDYIYGGVLEEES